MTSKIKLFTPEIIADLTNQRQGETKFGEAVLTVNSLENLEHLEAEYVLFGIPEDIGIRGNKGKPGAKDTFIPVLKSLLNIQKNRFNQPENLVILGEIDCDSFLAKAEQLNPKDENYDIELGKLVSEIDGIVTELVKTIVGFGKIPIAIGGGHNNCYGMIRGVSEALEMPINVLNIDAHTDLRTLEHRHSGNGFTYASEEGFLAKYFIFGLHKNYTSEHIFDLMDQKKDIKYFFFEDCLHLTSLDKLVKLKTGVDFLNRKLGLELDCDSIKDFNSSAMTPTGFSVRDVRTFIKLIRKEKTHYLHICEADASKNDLIGKALSYFISDFIREED